MKRMNSVSNTRNKKERRDKMLIVTPNFHFKGQCKEAIELYKKAFGAEVKVLLCRSDANPQDYIVKDPNQNGLVYHAEIYIGTQRIMLSDLERVDTK